jgi:UPF0755 protein
MNMPGEHTDEQSRGYRVFVFSAKTVVKILFVVLVVVVVAFLARRAYSLGYEVSSYKPSEAQDAEDVAILIREGMTAREVGELLIENGVIRESLDAFLIQERLSKYHDAYVPGMFVVNPSMNIEEILAILCTPAQEGENVS